MPISMSRDEIRAVYRQGEDAVVALIEMLITRFNALEEEVAVLKKQLGKANGEITRLKAQVAKDSHNSSKPPSSDMHREPKNLREKSRKPNGGQPGHHGHTLHRVENPDYVSIHKLHGQCRCGRTLNSGNSLATRDGRFSICLRFVWKLPSTKRRCEDADVESSILRNSRKMLQLRCSMAIASGRSQYTFRVFK